jgi:hypothetical protein
MIKLIIFSGLIVVLASCGRSDEESKNECDRLEMAEASQLRSRNAINEMYQKNQSDKTQQAINDADDAIDEIQRKLVKECGK